MKLIDLEKKFKKINPLKMWVFTVFQSIKTIGEIDYVVFFERKTGLKASSWTGEILSY